MSASGVAEGVDVPHATNEARKTAHNAAPILNDPKAHRLNRDQIRQIQAPKIGYDVANAGREWGVACQRCPWIETGHANLHEAMHAYHQHRDRDHKEQS
jgi:hypothetical protein